MQNNLFTCDCQYFHNEKTFVRTTEVKQCVLVAKIVIIAKNALYFLKTALLSASQSELRNVSTCITMDIEIALTATTTEHIKR